VCSIPPRCKAETRLTHPRQRGGDLLDFFARLPNPDKQYAQIAGAAHAITLSLNREGLWHVMLSFLTMPKTVQV